MDHPVANSLQELLVINNDEEQPGDLGLVRVQLNNEESLVGSIQCFEPDRHPDEFLFQQGVPGEVPVAAPLVFHLVPHAHSDGTEPRWLRFGEKPKEVHHVVCSGWRKHFQKKYA